jgi:hypothetical protein
MNRARVRVRPRYQQVGRRRPLGAKAGLAAERVGGGDVHVEGEGVGGLPAIADAHRRARERGKLEQIPEHLAAHLAARGPREPRVAVRGDEIRLRVVLAAAQPRLQPRAVGSGEGAQRVERGDDAVVTRAVALHADEDAVAIRAHDENVRAPFVPSCADEGRAERLVMLSRRAVHGAAVDLLMKELSIDEMIAGAQVVAPDDGAIGRARARARSAAYQRREDQREHSTTRYRRIGLRLSSLLRVGD